MGGGVLYPSMKWDSGGVSQHAMGQGRGIVSQHAMGQWECILACNGHCPEGVCLGNVSAQRGCLPHTLPDSH